MPTKQSVRVRYSTVTRAAKKRLEEAAQLAGTQQQTPKMVEEARIFGKFKKRAREDYGVQKQGRIVRA